MPGLRSRGVGMRGIPIRFNPIYKLECPPQFKDRSTRRADGSAVRVQHSRT